MDSAIARYIFEKMYAIRVFEEKVEVLFAKGVLPGFVHLYTGQEACAAGVCANLGPEDYITSTHRGHGHCIAKGGRLDRMMAELFAKKTGYNHGKGGSMHIAATEIGILGANGITAGGLPIAVGAGLTSMMLKLGRVAVAFVGDGATNQGTFHESVNLAAAFKIPVIFAVENNQYGVGTRFADVSNGIDIVKRAEGYGIPGVMADGMDVVSVYKAAQEAILYARAGNGPTIIEMKTWRYKMHFQGEPATYRSKDEETDWLKKDPIEIAKTRLKALGLLNDTILNEIEANVQKELERAVEFARNSPDPMPEDALTDLFA
ncbi:MAG TPA: thiamine pyrophosphate-dependent dehydrogenase E1 component subunit alpha [Bacteroidales bacterium]|nr:thiamine pyrophosphate-dependent dehydrogenase E1 component subunit alpha [Bacteroidales bacterium]